MSPRTLRCAVVGAGWWATTAHLPALVRHPRAEVVAVQKRDAAQARAVASDFGVPRACATLDEVLAIRDLDAVVVSSTPNAHFAQARAALARGLHVLVEKPMTLTAAEAQELVDLAARRGVQLVVSCPWHYTAHAAEAQRLVRSGALGRLRMVSILMTNFVAGLYRGLPWERVFGDSPTLQNAATPYLRPGQASYSDPAVAGGGQIYCQVSHVAAYVAFLTGARPADVFARFERAGAAVDVYDAISLRLADGALVSIASHGAPMLSDRQFEIRAYGDEGMLLMELWKGRMEFHDRACRATRQPDLAEADVYPLHAPAENLVDAALGLAPNRSPGELGLFAMEVIEASCASAASSLDVRAPRAIHAAEARS